jgi:hypothetical protein
LIELNYFCTGGCSDSSKAYCNGSSFDPFWDYRIIEGEVALAYKGWLRTQTKLEGFDSRIDFNDGYCDAYNNVRIKEG